MAGALKQTFLDAVRLTPDGIDAFLETPLPAVSSLVGPADDTATEALSAHLLKIFDALAGLTLVELLLRIGQHNSVLESAMIAGLEYIEGADSASNGITITEPATGKTYAPGEMRFTATTQNAFCVGISLTLDGGEPVQMVQNGATWNQYITVGDGEHSANMTAGFEDGSDASASVSFTVSVEGEEPPPGEDPPEPPQGTDNEALQRLKTAIESAYRLIVSFGNVGDPGEYRSRMSAFLTTISQFLAAVTITSSTISNCRAEIASETGWINTILGKSEISTVDIDAATTAATKIVNNIKIIYTIAVQ